MTSIGGEIWNRSSSWCTQLLRGVINISEGTAFLLKGLTYNDEVKLRRYNLKSALLLFFDISTYS